MKKIALITVGMNPVPAVKGGAVEYLVQSFIDRNEISHDFDIFLYSLYDKDAELLASNYRYTHFYFIRGNSLSFKIKRILRAVFNRMFFYIGNEYLYSIFKLMRRENFDLILLENFPMAPLFLKKKFSIPIILHIHNDWLNKNNANTYAICKSTDLILPVSNFIKLRIMEVFNDPKKFKTVYNGIDVKRFSTRPSEIVIHNIKSKYGIAQNDVVFIFSGRIHPDKGIKEMLMAFSLLKDYNNIKLLLIGASSYKDSEETPYYREVIKLASTMKDRVIFTNYIDYKDIDKYLHIGDIYMSTSICNEALPLSVIEAMAASLPIIALRSGGVPELLTEENAFIVEKDDCMIENLKEKMCCLLENRVLRYEMGLKSFEQAQKFSIEQYANNMIKYVREI